MVLEFFYQNILQIHFQNLPMNDTKIMGILNITPDSFSDGGKFFDEKKAIEHAEFMKENGAHIIDIGGESTRPNASYVNEDEETKRILKVIQKLAKDNFLISADTRNSSVMSKVIDKGARIINDISGMSDPLTPEVIAQSNASIVIMHMQGSPKTMQNIFFHQNLEDSSRTRPDVATKIN